MSTQGPGTLTRPGPSNRRFLLSLMFGWTVVWLVTRLAILLFAQFGFTDPLSFTWLDLVTRYQIAAYWLPFVLPAFLGGLVTAACLRLVMQPGASKRLVHITAGWLAAGVVAAWLPLTLVRVTGLYRGQPQLVQIFIYLLGGALAGGLGGWLTLRALTPGFTALRRKAATGFVISWLAAFTLAIGFYLLFFVPLFPHPVSGVVGFIPGIEVFFRSQFGAPLYESLRPLGFFAFERGWNALMPDYLVGMIFVSLVNGPLLGLLGGSSILALKRQQEGELVDEAPVALSPEDIASRQHSGCLSAFLKVAIGANVLIGLLTLGMMDATDPYLQAYMGLSGLTSLLGAGFAYATLKWKRWGVIGFFIAYLAGMLLSFAMGSVTDGLRSLIPMSLLLVLIRSSWRYMQ